MKRTNSTSQKLPNVFRYVPTVNLTDADRSNIKKQIINSKCLVFPAQLASEWGMCVDIAKNFIQLYQPELGRASQTN